MIKEGIVQCERIGKIGIIRFNKPPLNIGVEHSQECGEAIKWAETEADLNVIVFCANGKIFGAGADMAATYEYLKRGDFVSGKMDYVIKLNDRIANLPMVTIAALDGAAYGGALELALACDLRILAEPVSVSLTEVNFGTFPGAGGVHRIVSLMGYSVAAEHLFFARHMTAQEALQYHVANAIAVDVTAFDMAMQWAKELEEKPTTGIRAIKAALASISGQNIKYQHQVQQRIMQTVVDSGALEQGAIEFLSKKKSKNNTELK